MGNVASVDGNQKSGIHSPVEEKVVDPMIYGLFFPSLVFGLGISGCHPTNHQQSVDSLGSSPARLVGSSPDTKIRLTGGDPSSSC